MERLWGWKDCKDGKIVRMERLWEWKDCENGKVVRMERLCEWKGCENGKIVRMVRLWEWKDCEDGKIVRMVVSSENMNGVQDGCKKLILISMKFALFTFLQNNICTLIFRILSTDVYSAHIFHNFPWLNKMSSFSNIILIKTIKPTYV